MSNPVLSFEAAASQTTSGGSTCSGRTYSGLPAGTSDPSRSIIVVDGFRAASNNPLTGLTINGHAATRVAQAVNLKTYFTALSIWALAVPSGTTVDIATAFGTSLDNAEGIAVYAAYGLNSLVPTCVASDPDPSVPKTSLDVLSGGVVLSAIWALSQPGAPSWFGVTNDFALVTDPTSSSQYFSGASASNGGANALLWQSCLYAAQSNYEPLLLSAAFR